MAVAKRNPVAIWLFICCAMVFVASIIGAITRLTGSGLSITDWNPIMGALPPMSPAAWEKAFKGYQAIPQYQVLNRGMSLHEFKSIYFWEWLHRFWDRLIGVVFLLPFLWFVFKKKFDRRTGWYLAAIFGIGLLQGFIGWYMVQSGLSVRTSVSPYRLALHLGLALLIYALMLWAGMTIGSQRTVIPHKPEASRPKAQMRNPVFSFLKLNQTGFRINFLSRRLRREEKTLRNDGSLIHGWIALGFVVVTMVWGAFTAGLHAGEAYNTWPLMDGEVLPNAAFTLNPTWINAFENLALVQFIHRWLGPTTMLVVLAWVARLWQKAKADDRKWIAALGGMTLVQVGLGLATLLSHAEIVLAVMHQAGAIALMTLILVNIQRTKIL